MANNHQTLVINVLGKDSYDDCHIKGSINIPGEELKSYAQTLDKNQHIVVYCGNYMCPASAMAWKTLTDLGFKNVWAYEGGMAEWYQMGFPVEGSCKENYLKQSYEKPSEPHIAEIKTISAGELKRSLSSNK